MLDTVKVRIEKNLFVAGIMDNMMDRINPNVNPKMKINIEYTLSSSESKRSQGVLIIWNTFLIVSSPMINYFYIFNWEIKYFLLWKIFLEKFCFYIEKN